MDSSMGLFDVWVKRKMREDGSAVTTKKSKCNRQEYEDRGLLEAR